MSFQHFRLGDLALHHQQQHPIQHPLHNHNQQLQQPQQPQHLHHRHHQQQHLIPQQPVPGQSQFPVQLDNPITTFSVSLKKQTQQQQQHHHSKQPYGSGDADDGYTLAFSNLHEFNEWRQAEEERTMCEFVKGDTHGSKAVPPRFKDHTKLVCARHSRSGRKKYIKKHPERIRKVPSRKLEVGCPASISYKTYFDSDQVRACYISQHSHEIGLANLPFTRRGRKDASVKAEKEKTLNKPASNQAQENATPSAAVSITAPTPSLSNEQTNTPSATVSPQPAPSVPPSTTTAFSAAVSMLAPLPSQQTYTGATPQAYTYTTPTPQLTFPPPPPPPPPPPSVPANLVNDRWDNMATLFQSIRDHARNFEYPLASVAALETVLIRLYLESPVGIGAQPTGLGVMMPNGMTQPRVTNNVPTNIPPGTNVGGGTTNDGTSGSIVTEDGA